MTKAKGFIPAVVFQALILVGVGVIFLLALAIPVAKVPNAADVAAAARVVHDAVDYTIPGGPATHADCHAIAVTTWRCTVYGSHGPIASAQANERGAVFAPLGFQGF
jgi:hypothetical protein